MSRGAIVKDWPADPIRQHNRFIAAFCDDLASGHFSLTGGNAERVAEISRQVNTREPAQLDKRAGRNS